MKMLLTLASALLMACSVFAATPLQDKIAKTYKITRTDKWQGYDRAVIDFKGYEAWVVEPKVAPAYGKPWTWTMQWATAFPDRTGAPDMLARGWHHATIITFQHRMDEKGLAISREFQKYLVEELGFNEKASLIGMSWGGFFSTRYANTYPECVRSIYLDAPLLNFAKFGKASSKEAAVKRIGSWGENPPEDWNTDPRMPVNMAASLAKAKIPILLIYGGSDKVVERFENCERFLQRFKEAGGDIIVNNRKLFGHHPHGLDPTNTAQIYEFFLKHGPVAPAPTNSKKKLVKIDYFPVACKSVSTVEGEAPSILPNGKNFKLVWNDEFNGTELDTSKWSYRTNFWGKEAYWFAKPEDDCVEVKNGKVHLKLKKLPNGQFVSPQLQTGELIWDIPALGDKEQKGFWPLPQRPASKFLHKYGYYECRCRLQKKAGWWSAFWMQTPQQGCSLDPAYSGIEHDIMESFTPGEVIRAAFHYNGYGADYKGFYIPQEHKDIVVDTEQFHTYGMLWDENGYSVYIDGRLRGTYTSCVSHVPEFVLITTEAKWYRANKMTGKGVPELEDAVRANDDFVVDYVRVYDVVK
jgi:dienelactone hydrolase